MTPRNGVIAQNPFPPVPLLIIKPSITNNVKMLSKTFTITLAFFKNVLKVCVSATVFQLNLPQLMLQEIQKKIIDRISNVENCGEGIQLIINYFVALTDDKPDFFVQEVMVVFRQVKSFAYLFLEFMWRKALSGRRDEDVKIDKYFCKILPFKLILLYDIILFYSKENPFRFVMNFSKGLSWLDGLLRTGAQDTKTFLSKMNRFVVHLDPESRETVMKITQKLITEILNANISIDFMNEGGSF